MYISNVEVEMSGRGPKRVNLELSCVNSEDVFKMHYLYNPGNPVNVDIIPNYRGEVYCTTNEYKYCMHDINTLRKMFELNEKENKNMIPYIKKVIFNDPATIVFWADGTKTVAKAHGDDKFDKEVGLTVCIAKKALGNRSHFDAVFKKWIK